MKPKTAIKILLGIILTFVLFHFSIILKITPYSITWGGRLQTDAQMYVFESVSIVILLILAFLLLIKGKFIKAIVPLKIVKYLLWVFFGLFVLNTIGNIFAQTTFEKCFAIVTAAMAYLLWVVLSKGEKAIK